MSGRIEFPQPIVTRPEYGAPVWWVNSSKVILEGAYSESLREIFEAFELYDSHAGIIHRSAWNAQQMARLVMPAWLRKLGPDVQVNFGDGWEDLHANCCIDWSRANPAEFRAKLRDVVVTVNGKEYRWPQTVTKGETSGVRFNLAFETGVYSRTESDDFGPTVHHTRAGAEQQLAAIKAAAGESL